MCVKPHALVSPQEDRLPLALRLSGAVLPSAATVHTPMEAVRRMGW